MPLSAWYYELASALRAAGAGARTPDDATRAAFVERLAIDFPELAAIAKSIRIPRMFVPPPPTYKASPAAPQPTPAPAAPASPAASPPAAPSAPEASGVAPPAFVVPSQVKYEP